MFEALGPGYSDNLSQVSPFRTLTKWFKMRDVEDKPRLPLKTVLQNFLNHVDSMEIAKRERDNPFEKEFQVRDEFDSQPSRLKAAATAFVLP